MKYKIFDTLDEFNEENAKLNELLGFATNDSIELVKSTETSTDEAGNSSSVDYYTLGNMKYTTDQLKDNPSFITTDTGYATAPSTQQYAEPIETSDNKYAMPILNSVLSQFDESKLVDNIEIKQSEEY